MQTCLHFLSVTFSVYRKILRTKLFLKYVPTNLSTARSFWSVRYTRTCKSPIDACSNITILSFNAYLCATYKSGRSKDECDFVAMEVKLISNHDFGPSQVSDVDGQGFWILRMLLEIPSTLQVFTLNRAIAVSSSQRIPSNFNTSSADGYSLVRPSFVACRSLEACDSNDAPRKWSLIAGLTVCNSFDFTVLRVQQAMGNIEFACRAHSPVSRERVPVLDTAHFPAGIQTSSVVLVVGFLILFRVAPRFVVVDDYEWAGIVLDDVTYQHTSNKSGLNRHMLHYICLSLT